MHRLATAVLTVALMLGGMVALGGPVAAVSGERLTAQQAQACKKAREKKRAAVARVVKLRRAGARPAKIRKARQVRAARARVAARRCHPPKRPAPQPVVLKGTVVFGDSMTVNATPSLRALRPDWEIDALWGRGVTQLHARIRAWRAANAHEPAVAIFALGTNEEGAWGKASYEYAANIFPAETRIVFVNTYRPNAGIGTPQDGALYSGWMAEIAASRPRTEVADWRSAAAADHGLMYDNLHQTVPHGTDVWARLVVDATDRVLAQS